MEWNKLSFDDRIKTLHSIVFSVAEQLGRVLDTGEKKVIGSSVIISNGDLTSQVGMFRLDEDAAAMIEIGVISNNSGIEPNIVIAIKTYMMPDTGREMVIIHGQSAEGESVGFYHNVIRNDKGNMVREGGMLSIKGREDIGYLVRDIISPFLQGRSRIPNPPPSLRPQPIRHERQGNVEEEAFGKKMKKILSPGTYWTEAKK